MLGTRKGLQQNAEGKEGRKPSCIALHNQECQPGADWPLVIVRPNRAGYPPKRQESSGVDFGMVWFCDPIRVTSNLQPARLRTITSTNSRAILFRRRFGSGAETWNWLRAQRIAAM